VEESAQYAPRGHGIGWGRKRRGLEIYPGQKFLIYIIL